MRRRFAFVSSAPLLASLCSSSPAFPPRRRRAPKPPVAKKIARTTSIHGDTLRDDYFWMREKKDPGGRAPTSRPRTPTRTRS